MNHKPENERLLDDVFGETASAGFREAMVGETVRLARRRRRMRRVRGAGVVIAGVLLATLLWRGESRRPIKNDRVVSESATPKSYTLVHTRPLPVEAVVITQPLGGGLFAARVPAVQVVETTVGNFRLINDDQLFALVGRPAILIRTGLHSEELLLVDYEDGTRAN